MSQLKPSKIYSGGRLLVLGSTGFLGKVCLSMLLTRFPQIGRIYLMVRAGSHRDSESRFWDLVLPSPAFDPVRRRYGQQTEPWLRQKLVIVDGDITEENLGFSEEEAQRIATDIDVVLNCSGRVSFNPPLEMSLKTNVTGTLNIIGFARRMQRPAMIHVSTCFVAGNRSGEIWENEQIVGYFPRRGEPEVPDFSVETEIKDCSRLSDRVRDEAMDKYLGDRFREAAKQRFLDEGRDPDDERGLRIATASERKTWIRTRLTELGIDKANWWGWPNIYTYTKSLGEQVVAANDDIIRSIIRPAIVESAVEFPFAGWNEGFTTSAPLVHLALKGQNLFPVRHDLILDLIPVDHVAAATLAVTAQAMVEVPALVHQLSTGDLNPCQIGRAVTFIGLYKREHFKEKQAGNRLLNEIASRMETQVISPEGFERVSLPMIRKATEKVSAFLDRVPPARLGPLQGLAEQAKDAVARLDRFSDRGEKQFRTFRPFIVDNRYIFRTDNAQALYRRLPGDERALLPWQPESIDWYDYWLRVHIPGLVRWVFPRLDEEEQRPKRRGYTYRTLAELFDAATKNHRGRIAMRMERNGCRERYTYGELRECVLRAAAFLLSNGVQEGDRVGLVSGNRPEWGMSYFGIIKAGAICIPLAHDAAGSEIVNLMQAGQARALVLSDELRCDHPDLERELADAGVELAVWSFSDLFTLGEEAAEEEAIARLPTSRPAEAPASIIFTSGTTGTPKGVVLTHLNFTSLVAKLASVYDIGREDGMLSVLPLHHSFEFTTGFLLPLSRGAQITYLEELEGQTLSRTLKQGQITCIVGVPAFWDALKRRIMNRFSRSTRLEDLVAAIIDAHYLLRDETSLNLGPLLFLPVHLGLGGRIRYLISGGSALSEPTFKTLRGLGFNLNEGYGLTEAAPVLTVTRPDDRAVPGSAGKPLPGVEVRIDDPDARGVGEIIARGPNVMAGYYGDEEATRETIRDGWLHTGDLGRIDEEGNLFIVGRLKEVIVDASGKNIYPDELEEVYHDSRLIKELAVVGLPAGSGVAERVACLAVPDYEDNPDLEPARLRQKIEEHIRSVSHALPLYKRIKVLQLWDGELPRTVTRKVKRRRVVEILQRLHREAAEEAGTVSGDAYDRTSVLDLVASVCDRPRSEIHLGTRFDELGFDSLMYTELTTLLVTEAGDQPDVELLAGCRDLRELTSHVRPRRHPPWRPGSGARRDRDRDRDQDREEQPIVVPSLVAQAGRRGLSTAQQWFYRSLLEATIKGQAHIPQHIHFIVVANHASHLDMGLVKTALGDAGKNLVALAATDYFFDNRFKRAFFESFTNLLPVDRTGSLRTSLACVFQYLEQGYNILIFPEGTRSRSGEIQRFRRGVGHLARRARVGILPMYLSTHEALPPGSWYLKSTEISATIGPFLSREILDRLGEGLPPARAERLIVELSQRIVEALRDGKEINIGHYLEVVRGTEATELAEQSAEVERPRRTSGK